MSQKSSDEIQVGKFTFIIPTTQTGDKMNIIYGAPPVAPSLPKYFEKDDNMPDQQNKTAIFFPIEGKIDIKNDLIPAFVNEVNSVLCKLTSDKEDEIMFNIGNRDYHDFFTIQDSQYIQFNFDPNWDVSFLSPSLNNKIWFLELHFMLKLTINFDVQFVEFIIKSSTEGTYFTSDTNILLVPPIQFFTETNELVVTEPELTEPIAADGLININLGKPAVIGNPEYTYDLNVPNENNEVLLMAPFGFSVYIDNAKYPHGKFIGFSGTPEIKMEIPGMEPQEYNRMDEINNGISITNSGKAFSFKLNPDWNRRINAQTLNNAGECSLQFNFDIDIEVSEIEGAPYTETINVNSGTMQVDQIKYNCEVKAPKPEPEPIPVPETVLNNPVGTGSVIHIELGKPETTVTPEYAYDTIAPDCDNNISLMAPLEFTMTLDAIKYPNSVIKGISGAPVINMNIPNIGIKEYNSNAAKAVTITEEGKKLQFKLDPDWNQKVNATSLNESAKNGDAVIDFAAEIVIITAEKDGTKTTKKETVNSVSLQLKPINFNSEVQAPKPQPEPIPVPVTVLNAPVGSGSIINIQLGKPTNAGTPDYTYETNTPDTENTVALMAPLNFVVHLDNTVYSGGMFVGYSGNPLIQMEISGVGTINYNRREEDIANFFQIIRDGKTILFNLNPDWNVRVNADRLNGAGECILTFDFTLDIEIIDDSGFHVRSVMVNNNTLPVKRIRFNSQTRQIFR